MRKQTSIEIDNNFEYNPNDLLGKGSFGSVYKGTNMKTQEVVAIKVLDMSLIKDQYMIDSLKKEIKVMRQLKSQHVVHMYDVVQMNAQTCIVFEYCPEGDLRKFIRKNNGMLPEAIANDVLRQLMKGFEELTRLNYIHRDIKPENALVKGGVYMVSDFGFATEIDITGRMLMKECVGTPLYMAPQLLRKQPYSAKSDIWSIGMMYYEMIFGKTPWPCRDMNSLLQNIQCQPLKFPYEKPISINAQDFIRSCLVVDEAKRIGWQDVFKHPLIMQGTQQPNQVKILDPTSRSILKKLQEVVQVQRIDPATFFIIHDKDRNNQLDINEFHAMLFKISPELQIAQSRALFKNLQVGNTNTQYLDYSEFMRIFCEMDFADLNDRAGQILNDLKEIIRANKIQPEFIFYKFDQDKMGTLCLKEFSQMIRQFAPAIKDIELAEVFQKFDRNNDRMISIGINTSIQKPIAEKNTVFNYFNSLKNLLERLKTKIQQKKISLTQVFQSLDKSKDRKLDIMELMTLFQVIEQNITYYDAKILFKQFDRDNNGYVTFEEFRNILQ